MIPNKANLRIGNHRGSICFSSNAYLPLLRWISNAPSLHNFYCFSKRPEMPTEPDFLKNLKQTKRPPHCNFVWKLPEPHFIPSCSPAWDCWLSLTKTWQVQFSYMFSAASYVWLRTQLPRPSSLLNYQDVPIAVCAVGWWCQMNQSVKRCQAAKHPLLLRHPLSDHKTLERKKEFFQSKYEMDSF